MHPFLRIPFLALGAASWLASVQGCDGSLASPVGSPAVEGPAAAGLEVGRIGLDGAELEQLVERTGESQLLVRYRGTRRVLLVDPTEDGRTARQLEYLEHVGCDGSGRFAIETRLTGQADALDAEEFEIAQLSRQGYVFRLRDFAVRDPWAFRENYRVEPLGREAVAGVDCVVLGVERRDGTGPHHEIHLDPATGLVLRTEQRDERGRLLSRVGYESIEFGADLDGLSLDDHQLPRQLLDPGLDPNGLQNAVGFDARTPQPPPGFHLGESAVIASPSGRDWLKLTYTDGLESLVLLQAPEPQGVAPTWELGVTRVGGSTLVCGTLERRSVVALGRVGREFLLGWLDASF